MVQRDDREPGPMLLLGTPCYECRSEDFLPLCCDGCRRDFCVSHIKPESHACAFKPRNYFVPLCPLCQEPPQGWIRDASPADTQEIFAKHWNQPTISQGGCKVLADENHLQNNRPLSQSKTCSRSSCGKILHVAIPCPHCFNQFCVEHRAPLKHSCPAHTKQHIVDPGQSLGKPLQSSLRGLAQGAQIAGSSLSSKVPKPIIPNTVPITTTIQSTTPQPSLRSQNIRAKQERKSMILAMQSRHHKGLLRESEQLLLAEAMAEEASSTAPTRPRCPVI